MSAAEMPAGAAPECMPDWHSIHWRKVWRSVRRLQPRIVKAVAEDRWNKVKALVYLLTHSFSGRALAILRVVSNSGAKTPGVDGILWNTPEAKSAAFNTLRRHGYRPATAPPGVHSQEQRQMARSRDSHDDRPGQRKHSTCWVSIPSRNRKPTAIPMAFGGNAAVPMPWNKSRAC